MAYDFECKIVKSYNISVACGLYIKTDYPDIVESKYESYCGIDVVEWFVGRVDY